MRIPEDVSIIGFDDSFLAEVSEVKLTSVSHPQGRMGEMAAQVILDIVKESSNGNPKKLKEAIEPIVFSPELVVRNSTAKPK